MKILRPLLTLAAAAGAAVLLGCGEPDTPTGIDPGGDDSLPGPGPGPVDSIPPAAVSDLVIAYDPAIREAWVEWTAPHDDTPSDTVDRYEIRYSTTRGYFPPDFWDLSIRVSDPPVPAAPGARQRYTFPNPDRGTDLYVGVRSYDAAGNVSPPSDIVSVHIEGIQFTGRCVDALTGLPIAGLAVRLSAGRVFDLTTDANGRFSRRDLFPGGVSVEVETGDAATVYHRMSQLFVAYDDTSHSFAVIPYQPTVAPVLGGMSLLALFRFLTGTDNSPGTLARYRMSPVPTYAPPYVNGSGIDYQAQTKRAAQRWMDVTGRQIWRFVDSPPDSGVIVSYLPRAVLQPLVAKTDHTTGADLHPIRDEIKVVDDMTSTETLYRVMLHELGHTIRLGHLQWPGFIMFVGQPLPGDISPDEVNVVILHQSLPVRVNMSIYDTSVPAP